jgi:hypothetical protein
MTDADPGTKGDICWDILHAFVIEGGLKFRRHEAVPVSGVHQAEEVNRKDSNVKSNRDNNKAKHTCKEMFEP